MAKERGVVFMVVRGKRHCFIRPEPSAGHPSPPDVHCNLFDYPRGEKAEEGDQVAFEVENQAGKGPTARNVSLIAKASANAGVGNGLAIELFYAEPRKTGDAFELEVRVKVTLNSRLILGAVTELNCFAADKIISRSCISPGNQSATDTEGLASYVFAVYRKEDDAEPVGEVGIISFAANATHEGQTAKISRCWPVQPVTSAGAPLPEPQAQAPVAALTAAAPAPTPTPKLTVKESEVGGQKQYLVRYGTPDAVVPAEFKVRQTRGSSISASIDGGLNWQTGTGELIFPPSGESVVQVKINKLASGVGGENFFIGVVQDAAQQSGPHYISGI